MTFRSLFRRAATPLVAVLLLAGITVATPIALGALSPAQAQATEDFHVALEAYGTWQPHPRWGEVWVPYGVPPDWRPYSYGHWVYTDEWGWYWVSDPEEEAWGWITFHYGRWQRNRELGWYWVPGDEWGPAWVNWRGSDDYVGWAPLPPDDVIYEYDDDPAYWVFVQPRYLIAPRLRTYYVPVQQRVVILQRTIIVNRTLPVVRGNVRFAVNAGIAPQRIAFFARSPVPTFQVRPRVLAGTVGVAGAVSVRAQDVRPAGFTGRPGPGHPPPRANLPPVSIQRAAVVQVNTNAAPPPLQALPRNERGRLGTAPPRAAQGATPQQQAPAAQPQHQQQPAPQQQQAPQGAPPVQQQPQHQAPQTPPPAPAPQQERRVTPPVSAPPVSPPPRQEERREEHREGPPPPQHPVEPPQLRPQNEPPPQARPERPIAPQAPPPPPPAVHAPERPQAPPPQPPHPQAPPPPQPHPQQPPPQAHPAPPPQAPKPPPPAQKPEEKKPQ